MPKFPTLLDDTVLMRSYDGSTVNDRPRRHSIVDRSCGSSARPLVSRARTFSPEAPADRDVRLDAAGARRIRGAGAEVVDHGNGRLHGAIDAADRTDRLEGRARIDRARAHLIDLGARQTDREEEEDVLSESAGSLVMSLSGRPRRRTRGA